MAVSASSLTRLRDKLEGTQSRAMRFSDEFEWAEERQIEHYGPKTFGQLADEHVKLSNRRIELSERLRRLSIKASWGTNPPEFPDDVAKAKKDAKAWLKDCEAWLSDARVAIPYKLGIDGRPLGKE